ncbi:hypothetical protein [Streptomyces melanogenes]|uniref:hypothetical protein n=1 Tax=Streptomyces melanogenes TaxID=67326 RepID=UPI00378903E2
MSSISRKIVRLATAVGSLALALTVGTSTALPAPLATCTLRVQSRGASSFRDGLSSGSCVAPSIHTDVNNVAAGNRTGRAEFTILDGAGCSGNVIGHGVGEADYLPHINFTTIRIDNCP